MRLKVLSIGHSFAQDSTRYLSQIARADGHELNVVNLYIGGCALSRHYRNMLTEDKAYSLEYNGHQTGFPVSLKQALFAREWDVIVLQQTSVLSTDYSSFQPYLSELSAYIKKMVPLAKQYIHETWAYEEGSSKLENMGFECRKDMYDALHASYSKAAEDISAYGIIPSGTMFQRLIEEGVTELHRDHWHASKGIGRYALALLWYRTLLGEDVTDNGFCDFDAPVDQETVKIIKKVVNEFRGGKI